MSRIWTWYIYINLATNIRADWFRLCLRFKHLNIYIRNIKVVIVNRLVIFIICSIVCENCHLRLKRVDALDQIRSYWGAERQWYTNQTSHLKLKSTFGLFYHTMAIESMSSEYVPLWKQHILLFIRQLPTIIWL